MQQSNAFGICLRTAASLALCLGLAQIGKADTITDTSLDVDYTATSTFTPVTDNMFDVFLIIDPTVFDAGSGFLTAFSLAFNTVSLVTAPGGVSAWSTEMPGGLDSSDCNGKGVSSGDVCFQNPGSAGTPVPGGPYKFEFAVTMPDSVALTAASDIKAAFNSLQNNSGKNLGQIQKNVTPEPSTLLYMSAVGLLMAFVASRRRQAYPRSRQVIEFGHRPVVNGSRGPELSRFRIF